LTVPDESPAHAKLLLTMVVEDAEAVVYGDCAPGACEPSPQVSRFVRVPVTLNLFPADQGNEVFARLVAS